ncbi:phosphorylated adapter RNA export protein [Boleophthalmus pectinirostris]|uniref:phosphorylated adapter RNA export protein n=1 Tax=Boleophthalmus pectinirostris TaxID=150288 RepID=UPI000A1C6472|nr:phosphorylated adapter RNA export protein [Boleophthalmus pectinirostris]
MDADLEDGELSGSDLEMTPGSAALASAHAAPPAAFQSRPAFQSSAAFQSRPAASHATPAGYRSCPGPADSSDSDQDSSDDEAGAWRRKRQKVTNNAPPARMPAPAFNPAGRKVNNIWGSVVQEQCQDAVAAELGIFGVDAELDTSSRNVETYNYVLARKMMEKEREMERQSKGDGEVNMLDAQLDEYMKERGEGDAKRKRPVKERLGPKAEMDIKGRYEITEDDPPEKVAEEIAHRLREPKVDLIERVVAVIGTGKALELLGETATLEETGGVYTLDGSRRRTPGGVYLNLLKNTPSISKSQLKKIFLEENRQEVRSKKAAQKRRRHLVAKKMKQAIGTLNLQEHDDVSRETFASDTNEALEALEEGPEEEEGEDGEEREAETPEPKPAGTEENPVVYSAADLEVF